MATAARPVRTADDRAWDLIFEALDSDGPSAARIPPGAAIVAADAVVADRLDLGFGDLRSWISHDALQEP